MSRAPKASYDDIARACAKLQVDGCLNIHNLRQALGGGGSDYLMRHYRTWLQAQREAARVPFENRVSDGLRAALQAELQAAQDSAAQEVHALYTEEKEHLAFCLTEMRRLEKEVETLHDQLAAEQLRSQAQHARDVENNRDATEHAHEQRVRADRLAERLADLQRQDSANQAELAVAREQRSAAENRLGEEMAQRKALQVALMDAINERSTVGRELAASTERCAQQSQMIAYLQADVQAKVSELIRVNQLIAEMQKEMRSTGQRAAAAQAALQELRLGKRTAQAVFVRGLVKAKHTQKKKSPDVSTFPASSHKSRA